MAELERMRQTDYVSVKFSGQPAHMTDGRYSHFF